MPEDENNFPTTVTPNNSTIEPPITPSAATDPLDPWQVQGKYTLANFPLIIKNCFIIYMLCRIIYYLCLDFGLTWIDGWSLATKLGILAMLVLAVTIYSCYTVRQVSIQNKFKKWLRN